MPLPANSSIPTKSVPIPSFKMPAPGVTPAGNALPTVGSAENAINDQLGVTADDLAAANQSMVALGAEQAFQTLIFLQVFAAGVLALPSDPVLAVPSLKTLGSAMSVAALAEQAKLTAAQATNLPAALAAINAKIQSVATSLTNTLNALSGTANTSIQSRATDYYDRLAVWVKDHTPEQVQQATQTAAQVSSNLTSTVSGIDAQCTAILGTLGQIESLLETYNSILGIVGGNLLTFVFPTGFPFSSLAEAAGLTSIDFSSLSACAGIITVPPVPVLTP